MPALPLSARSTPRPDTAPPSAPPSAVRVFPHSLPQPWQAPAAARTVALGEHEIARVESGAWFGALSPALRQSILARSRVRQVARGTVLVRRGAPVTDWIGVAGGALRLGASAADGRAYTLEFISPGEWYGDIALVDGGAADLDLIAHVPSTLLMLPRADLQRALNDGHELRDALLQLDCRRLRHMARRFEEQQTLPLAQRVALALQRLARQFGRPQGDSVLIDLPIAQGDLADLLCASRQRVNGALRRMQQQGVVTGGPGRTTVLRPARLGQLAAGRATA